jgi:hypothetical protein
MATTQIAQAIVPEVFASYMQQRSVEQSLLIRSGIVERNPQLDAFLAGGGYFIQMPAWEDLADSEPNHGSTADTAATIDNITTSQENGVRLNRNKVFGARDLVGQLAGSDPMDAIANRFAAWWNRQDQTLMLSIIKGLMLEDVLASGTPDLLNDVSVSGTPATAANQFSANNLLDTFQLLGDGKNSITAIAVHSYIHTQMVKQDLIDFRPDSEANIGFGTYMGKTLLVDDGLTVTAGNDGSGNSQPAYDTVCFARGAFQLGFGSPRVPVEVDRLPLTGHGAGEEYIVSRREYCLHPVGFSIDMTAALTEMGASKQSLDNAYFETDGAYDRVDTALERQRAQRLVVLRSN